MYTSPSNPVLPLWDMSRVEGTVRIHVPFLC
jgi:hypothetical protein